MSEQVEALRLADGLQMYTRTMKLAGRYDGAIEQVDAAAAELRRQHQEIRELRKAKEELLSVLQSTEFYLEVVRYNIEHHFPEMTRLQVQDTVHETLVKYKD